MACGNGSSRKSDLSLETEEFFALTESVHLIYGIWSLKYCTLLTNEPVHGNLLRDKEQSRKRTNTRTKKHPNRDDLELFNVEHVTTNAKHSHFWDHALHL